MSSIVEKLKSSKGKKRAKVTIALDSSMKAEIEYICNQYDINMSEYLEELLEKSEIHRVYKKSKKSAQIEQKKEDENETSDSSTEEVAHDERV